MTTQCSCVIRSCIYVVFFYHRFMLRKMTSSMDRRVTSRDPKTLKSMGCEFSVAVSLFIDSHQYDRGQAQGSPLGVPKGINLEARYTCAHQKIKFHRWREFAWSLFPQFDQLLCNCRDFVSWSKHRWVCFFFCPTLGKKRVPSSAIWFRPGGGYANQARSHNSTTSIIIE